ncbi:hypothetical protein [Chryseobacterium sp. 2R14A]|uniref:hypothetical protein n=1 Tax=Chryseobacterium sp. 2R14A TaxID=3380353 RepID=UPI003CF2CAF9
MSVLRQLRKLSERPDPATEVIEAYFKGKAQKINSFQQLYTESAYCISTFWPCQKDVII